MGSNNTSSGNFCANCGSFTVVIEVIQWFIVCTGFPLTLMTIYALYSLIKSDHTAPVYVINLLMSDLIQLCCVTVCKARHSCDSIIYVYLYAIMTSVGFMVCVSLERYLVIARPLWYKFRRKIKIPLLVCAVVWMLPLVYIVPVSLSVDVKFRYTIVTVFLLLPLPLFIFFLVGTLRALSGARSVPADEKRRIVAILVVVLLIYILLGIPVIIFSLAEEFRKDNISSNVTFTFLMISPLADLTMYIFIRKGAIDNLLASLCCCNVDNSQQTNSTTNDSSNRQTDPNVNNISTNDTGIH